MCEQFKDLVLIRLFIACTGNQVSVYFINNIENCWSQKYILILWHDEGLLVYPHIMKMNLSHLVFGPICLEFPQRVSIERDLELLYMCLEVHVQNVASIDKICALWDGHNLPLCLHYFLCSILKWYSDSLKQHLPLKTISTIIDLYM